MAAQRQFKIARQPQMRPPLATRGGKRMLQQRQKLIRRQLLPQGPADLAAWLAGNGWFATPDLQLRRDRYVLWP